MQYAYDLCKNGLEYLERFRNVDDWMCGAFATLQEKRIALVGVLALGSIALFASTCAKWLPIPFLGSVLKTFDNIVSALVVIGAYKACSDAAARVAARDAQAEEEQKTAS